jgi:Zn-dependent M28 family amino/carboxypeptidase
VPLLADIVLSGVVPGAGDNASGVATVLRLADRYGEQLDSFDVWVLLTGAQESMQLGMSAFLKRHRKELDRSSTVFVCVDDVGRGKVRYTIKEGYILAYPFHPDLIGLCNQLREEDREDGYYGVEPIVSRIATDAHRARVAGYPAIAIGCVGEEGFPPHYHQATDTVDTLEPEALQQAYEFCSELVELIDEKIGPELEAPAEHASR